MEALVPTLKAFAAGIVLLAVDEYETVCVALTAVTLSVLAFLATVNLAAAEVADLWFESAATVPLT